MSVPMGYMGDIRENLGLDADDDSRDDEIDRMSHVEQLGRIAEWNGLIGYGDTIKDWVEEVYGIDLDECAKGVTQK